MAIGEIHPIGGATIGAEGIKIPLVLAPYEAKVIVVGPLPKEAAAAEPSFAAGKTLAELTGDWKLEKPIQKRANFQRVTSSSLGIENVIGLSDGSSHASRTPYCDAPAAP